MRIAMIGSGYVGLVSGACFADFGHVVTCVDKDAGKVASLLDGKVPIYEPGLPELVVSNQKAGRLFFVTEMADAVAEADAVFIAVGTPSRRGDGHADLTYVYEVAAEIAQFIDGYTVIVTKSTVPIGTGRRSRADHQGAAPGGGVLCRLEPRVPARRRAIEDFKRPDRIVVGAEDERARAVMTEVYRPLYLNRAPILFTARRTSELIKYASNAFLATKITFINEIADLCESVGADVQDVARGIGLDNRIGGKFLHAGPGYGGSCFPKDTLALIKTGQDAGTPLRIVEVVAASNDYRKRSMARKIIMACGGSVRTKKIAILGLTFKPNTDDMRESPALIIITVLQDGGADVVAYDPQGIEQARPLLDGVRFAADPYSCAEGADAVVIMTEWNEFRALDLARLRDVMRGDVLVDLRNVYNAELAAQHGFAYTSIGRTAVAPLKTDIKAAE